MVRLGFVGFIGLFSAFCINAEFTLHFGCDNFSKLTPDTNGYFPNIDIMPGVNVPGYKQNLNNITITDCEAQCKKVPECDFFTFEKGTNSQGKCFLKPRISDAYSPMMYYNVHDTSNLISGQVSATACRDLQPILDGCGASSPAVCSSISNNIFDARCSIDKSTCTSDKFPCCNNVNNSQNCHHRIVGKIIEKKVPLFAYWRGIETSDECEANCTRNARCTHWTFSKSSSTVFIGSTCYLYNFLDNETVSHIVKEEWQNVSGEVCGRYSKIVEEKSCEGIDRAVFTKEKKIYATYNGNLSQCRDFCKTVDGCKSVMYRYNTHCILTANDTSEPTTVTDMSVIYARDCGDEESTEVAPKFKLDTQFTNTTHKYAGSSPVDSLALCANVCRSHSSNAQFCYDWQNCTCYNNQAENSFMEGFVTGPASEDLTHNDFEERWKKFTEGSS